MGIVSQIKDLDNTSMLHPAFCEVSSLLTPINGEI